MSLIANAFDQVPARDKEVLATDRWLPATVFSGSHHGGTNKTGKLNDFNVLGEGRSNGGRDRLIRRGKVLHPLQPFACGGKPPAPLRLRRLALRLRAVKPAVSSVENCYLLSGS